MKSMVAAMAEAEHQRQAIATDWNVARAEAQRWLQVNGDNHNKLIEVVATYLQLKAKQ